MSYTPLKNKIEYREFYIKRKVRKTKSKRKEKKKKVKVKRKERSKNKKRKERKKVKNRFFVCKRKFISNKCSSWTTKF